MVLEFFDRFYLACRSTYLSEIEAFFIIKEFLAGKARSLYESVALYNITYTGMAV